MSSRGSVAVNGHYMNNEYKTIEILRNGEKIIEGLGNNHSMPDYSFSQNNEDLRKESRASYRDCTSS